MTTWVRFAGANLLRNRRRSFYTIMAIAMGYAAVNIFGGFTVYIFKNLGDSFVYVQASGHLTVFKNGFLTEGRIDPLKYQIDQGEMEIIRRTCRSIPQISLTTPQLQIMGLLTNGSVSTIFIGNGRIPSDTNKIKIRAGGMLARMGHKFYTGRMLEDSISHGAGLSFGLAEKLHLSIGSDVIAMAPTVDGRVNALDMEVFQTFSVPVEELNDKVVETPLQFAQSLYDTDNVDRMTILLEDDRNVDLVKEKLQHELDKHNVDMEVKSWQEQNPFYTKVKKMFDVIFIFVFIIVFIISVTSVVNTLSMSVIERTREIGTLRALGLKRSGIVRLFAMESAMLGILGGALGFVITTAICSLVKIWQPHWMPPNIVVSIPLEVYLVPSYLGATFLFLVLLSAVVAVLPARKAAGKRIVDALGHV
jgi:putative ABC transport system permease protein